MSDANGQRPGPEALRVAHVIAGLEPAHGGPSYCVPRLCEALSEGRRVEPSLYSVETADRAPLEPCGKDYACRTYRWSYSKVPVLGALRLSTGLSKALRESVAHAHVLHNHGLWLAPNIEAGWAARRADIPFVVTPHGMLSEVALKFSSTKKRLVWAAAQGAVARSAACIHATSDSEREDIRALGLKNPVAVVANGIDIPECAADRRTDAGDRVILALGRLHPKKNFTGLVRAWARVAGQRPEWRLRIVGPAEDRHDADLLALVKELGVPRVSIEGPAYDELAQAAYAAADLFVLPTTNENFGLTVAEALAAGTPVISSKGAPWAGLEREGCGWWVHHGVEPLAATLELATGMPRSVLRGMGVRGREWMIRDFSWDRVAGEMADVYEWLVRRGEPPACVRLD